MFRPTVAGSSSSGILLDAWTDRGEVRLLLRYVLLEAPGLGRSPRPLQPERLQGSVDRLPVDNIGVQVSLELQVGDYGARFFSTKDRKAPSRVVVGGHGTVPPRVDERRPAVPDLESAVPGSNLGSPVGEPVRQMEQRVRRLEPAAQVGDQIRRKEVPETSLREEAERVRMAVQKACIDTPPILHVLEGTHLLVRFAPFETTLQETPSRMLVPRESDSNLPDHNFSVAHAHSPGVSRPTVVSYCEPSPTPCGD